MDVRPLGCYGGLLGGEMAPGVPTCLALYRQNLRSTFRGTGSDKDSLRAEERYLWQRESNVTCCVDLPILWIRNLRTTQGWISGNTWYRCGNTLQATQTLSQPAGDGQGEVSE